MAREQAAGRAERTPKVLLVGKGAPERGGIASFLQGLVDSRLRDRFGLTFLNLTRGERGSGGRLTPGNLGRTAADAMATFRAARRHDVVHVHSALAPTVTLLRAGMLLLAARAGGARPILHAHGGRLLLEPPRGPRRTLARLALLPARRVAVVSGSLGDLLGSVVGRDRVVRVPNGVDTLRFSPGGEEEQPPPVLFVGILTPRKGVVDLIRASQALHQRGVEHQLWLVGGMPDDGGEAERAVRAAAGPEVRFLGSLPPERVAAVYREAAVLCLPSWWEAMPLSVLEAMASGLPVVASRVGAIPEMVEEGVTGALVEPGDVETLTGALEALLSDPDLRRKTGEAGRRRVVERFSLEGTLERIAELYEEESA